MFINAWLIAYYHIEELHITEQMPAIRTAGWSLGTYFSLLSAAAARTRGTEEHWEVEARDSLLENQDSQQ